MYRSLTFSTTTLQFIHPAADSLQMWGGGVWVTPAAMGTEMPATPVNVYLWAILSVALLWTPRVGHAQSAAAQKDAFSSQSSAISVPTFRVDSKTSLLVPYDPQLANVQFSFVPVTADFPKELPLGTVVTFKKNSRTSPAGATTYTLSLDLGGGTPSVITVSPIPGFLKTERSQVGTILSPNTTNTKLPKISGPMLVVVTETGSNEVINLFLTEPRASATANALAVARQPVVSVNLADQQSFSRIADALSNTKLQEQLGRILALATTPEPGVPMGKPATASRVEAFNTAVNMAKTQMTIEELPESFQSLVARYTEDAKSVAAATTKSPSAVAQLEREFQVLTQWLVTGRVLELFAPGNSAPASSAGKESAPTASTRTNSGSSPGAGTAGQGRAPEGAASPSMGSTGGSTAGTSSGGGVPNQDGTGGSTVGGASGRGGTIGGSAPPAGGSQPLTGGGSQPPGGGPGGGGSPGGGGYPAEPACPNFGLSVKKVNGQPGDNVRSVTLTWKSALNTYDYKVRLLERTTKSTYIFPFTGTMLDYTTAPLPTGIYDAWVSERSRNGGVFKEQCTPTEVKFPFECPAFKEPAVTRKSNGEISLSTLRDSGTLWFEILTLKPGAKLPNLLPNDQGVFQSPQSKACYEASKYATMSSPTSPFGTRVKQDGRFSTNDPILMQSSSSGAATLVCLYLCPSCMPRATLEGRPDSFVRAFLWQADKEGDNSSLSAFSPGSGSTISNTLKPTIVFSPSRDATGYEVQIRNRTSGALVTTGKDLTVPEFTPPDRLAPGEYTAASRTSFRGTTGNFSDAVPFSLTIPPVTALQPTGTVQTTRPTFTWEASEQADATYEVRVDDVTSTPKTVLTQNGITTIRFAPSGPLIPGKQYAWFVRAKVGAYVGDWGDGGSFMIPEQLPALQSPLKYTTGLQPFISWSPVPMSPTDKVVYQIQGDYMRGTSVLSNAFTESTAQTFFQPTKDLRLGSSLQLKVRAIINGTPLAWSKAVTLQVTKGQG